MNMKQRHTTAGQDFIDAQMCFDIGCRPYINAHQCHSYGCNRDYIEHAPSPKSHQQCDYDVEVYLDAQRPEVTLMRIDVGATSNIKTHLRVDEILSGGCVALLHIHFGSVLGTWFGRPMRPVSVFLMVLPIWLMSCHQDWPALNYLRPYLAATLVGVCCWGHLPVLTWILTTHILKRVAQMSYAIFIYHPLMIFGPLNTGSLAERYLLKRPISYALTFGAAWVSTYIWERRWTAFARDYAESFTRESQKKPAK